MLLLALANRDEEQVPLVDLDNMLHSELLAIWA
jgi:hypothetical protein